MPQTSPSHGRSLPHRLLPAMLFLLVLCLGGWLGAPLALEQLLLVQMREAGVEQPRVQVEALRPGRIALSGLSGANLGLEVQRAILHFSIQGLLQGSADKLEIHGLTWRLKWTKAGPDPGLPFRTPSSPGRPDSPLPLLPIKHIQVRSSYLQWQYGDFAWPQPLAGDIRTQSEQGLLEFKLRSRLLGIPLRLEGEADLQQATLSAQARIPESGKPAAPLETQAPALQAGLNATWQQDLHGSGQGTLQAALQTANLRWPDYDVSLNKLVLDLRAEMDTDLHFEALDLDLRLAGLRLDQYLLSRLTIALDQTGTRLAVDCDLQQPAPVQLTCNGALSPIQDFRQKPASWQGDFTYELQGKLPQPWLNTLAGTALLESSALPVTSSGRFKTRLKRSTEQFHWQADLQAEQTLIGPADLAWPERGLRLEGVSSRAPLHAAFNDKGLEVTLSGDRSLGCQAADLTVDGKNYALSSLWLKPQPGDRIRCRLTPDGHRFVELDVRLADPVRLQGPDIRASLQQATLAGKLQRQHGHAWHGVVEAGLEGGRLAAPQQDLALTSVSASIPLILGDAQHEPGRFHVGSLRAKGTAVPGPQGDLRIRNRTLELGGRWQVLPDIALQMDVDLTLAGGSVSGTGRVSSDWFALPEPEMLSRFSPTLGELDLDLSGSAKLDLRAELHGQQVLPWLELNLRDATLQVPKQNLRLQGLNVSAAFDSLVPLQTAARQGMAVSFGAMSWRDIEVRHGDLALRLVQDRLLLDSGSCRLAPQGALRIYEGRWDLEKAQGAARVYLEEIDALHLVQKLTGDKLVGSGRFSGSFALGWDGQGINLDEGHLYALPGTGKLGIRDEAWMDKVLFYVRQSLAGQKYLSLLSDRLEQALREFEYDFFSLRLVPRDSDIAAQIELRGQGVRGDPPQRVGSLVFNISDVQQALNQALHWGKKKAVRRALDELFGPAQ